MTTPPDFSVGQVLTAAQMNAVGLWLISSGTSSGATSYNYDGVFTSSFRNYRVVLSDIECATVPNVLRWNYRVGGATNIANVYDYAYRGLRSSGVAADTSLANAAFAEPGVVTFNFANLKTGSASIDVLSPVDVSRTFALSQAIGYEGGAYQMRNGGFVQNSDTAFDGFRLSLSGSGNFSLRYAIYGYRD